MQDKIVNIIFKQGSEGQEKVRQEVKETYKQATEHTKKFTRESDNELENWSKGVENRFNRITEYIVAAFAVDQIVSFSKEAIKSAEEMQTAYNQLKFVVTSVAKEGAEAYKKLVDQSNNLSKSLNNLFSNSEIVKAQTYLSTIGLNSKQILAIMPRIADISGRLHRPLDELAQTFSNAIGGGRAQELKTLGINFQTTGDKVKDFNLLMQNSEQFIGGAADAMGDFASQQQIANNEIEDMKTKLGTELAPIWNKLELNFLNGIHNIILGFNHLGDSISKALGNKGNSILEGYKKDLQDSLGDVVKLQDLLNTVKNDLQYGGLKPNERTEFLQFYNEVAEAFIKAANTKVEVNEKVSNSEHDLTKLTLNELNVRMEAAKNESKEYLSEHGKTINDMDSLNTIGFNKEVERINKEIEARKKGNQNLLELQKKFSEELKKIQDTTEGAASDLSEATGKDKDTSRENIAFQKKLDVVGEEITKLQEIKSKGTKEQKEQAVFAEEGLNKAIEELTRAHEIKLQEIKDKAASEAARKLKEKKDKEFEELKKELDDTEKLEQATLNNQLTDKLITQVDFDNKEYQNKKQHLMDLLLLERKYGEDTADTILSLSELKNKAEKDEIKEVKEYVKEFVSLNDEIINQYLLVNETQQKSNDYRLSQQDKLISEQEALANQGLANDLAFEIRRRDQITAQQIQLQEKQRKAKEFEAFLNMIVKLTETEKPAKALADASIGFAAMKVVEGKYASEGGMVEDLGKSGRHTAPEHLVTMEEGEGIFSRKEVINMGGKDAFYELKDKFQTPALFEKALPNVSILTAQIDMAPVVEKLDKLEKTILNKKETTVDWEALNMRIVERENGQVINTTHKTPNKTRRPHSI